MDKNLSLNLSSISTTNIITLGNDIVNLSIDRYKFPNIKPKFLNRIFTLTEQLMIQTSSNPTITTWMLWAAKEAAFKAYQKIDLNLIFAHAKFEAEFDIEDFNHKYAKLNNHNIIPQEFLGKVTYKNQANHRYIMHNLIVKWCLINNLIHCIAIFNQNNLNNSDEKYSINLIEKINIVKSKIFKINSENYATESAETKLCAKQFLLKHGFAQNIEIIRKQLLINNQLIYMPPMLFLQQQPLPNIQISLSHDYGWGAFAYLNLH